MTRFPLREQNGKKKIRDALHSRAWYWHILRRHSEYSSQRHLEDLASTKTSLHDIRSAPLHAKCHYATRCLRASQSAVSEGRYATETTKRTNDKETTQKLRDDQTGRKMFASHYSPSYILPPALFIIKHLFNSSTLDFWNVEASLNKFFSVRTFLFLIKYCHFKKCHF